MCYLICSLLANISVYSVKSKIFHLISNGFVINLVFFFGGVYRQLSSNVMLHYRHLLY